MNRRSLLTAALAAPVLTATPALSLSPPADVIPLLPHMAPAWAYGNADNLWAVVNPCEPICDGVHILTTGLLVRVNTFAKRVWNGVAWQDYDKTALADLHAGRVVLAFERIGNRWITREPNDLL